MNSSATYGAEYFAYQREMGDFGGWAEMSKFTPHLRDEDAVLDFGCGGGFLLRNLRNPDKAGLEINPEARKVCAQAGLTVYADLSEIPDGHFDVVISNHALEHCTRPLDEILALKRTLRPCGRMIFYVPCEGPRVGYDPGNRDHHLYTWSPMNLGNLFAEAGLEVLSAGPFNHRWPERHRLIARLFGRRGFEFCCRICGLYMRNVVSQTYCFARLP